jgi:hypothetical protein
MPGTQPLTRFPMIPLLTFYVRSGPPFRRIQLTPIFIILALRSTQYRFSLDVRAQPSYHARSYTTADLEYFFLAQRGEYEYSMRLRIVWLHVGTAAVAVTASRTISLGGRVPRDCCAAENLQPKSSTKVSFCAQNLLINY